MGIFRNIVILGLGLFFFMACNDTCGENKNAIPLAHFYVAGEPPQQVSVDSLEVRGIGAPGDSVWSPASIVKTELYLPFKIDSDTTQYEFSIRMSGQILQSLVTFVYSRTPRFTDAECGVSYIYDIRKIECSGNLIDSVVCPKGFIDNTNAENLQIYLTNR